MKKLYYYKGFTSKLESNIILKRCLHTNKDKTYELRGYKFMVNEADKDDDEEEDEVKSLHSMSKD